MLGASKWTLPEEARKRRTVSSLARGPDMWVMEATKGIESYTRPAEGVIEFWNASNSLFKRHTWLLAWSDPGCVCSIAFLDHSVVECDCLDTGKHNKGGAVWLVQPNKRNTARRHVSRNYAGCFRLYLWYIHFWWERCLQWHAAW